jgi:Tol biopolymer transport system component
MRPASCLKITAVLAIAACVPAASAEAVSGSVTEIASVTSSGKQETGRTLGTGSLSGDGRFVAFWSNAANLSTADADPRPDIFLHDRLTGTTQLVTRGVGGVPANIGSAGSDDWTTSLSEDGHYLAYDATDSNLVSSDTNERSDVFVWDSQSETTTRVSVATGGAQADGASGDPSISDDGSRVVFASGATNLSNADTNGADPDIYLHDATTGETKIVSLDGTGTPSLEAGRAVISGNGRYVLFRDDPNSRLFVRDLTTNTSTLVSIDVDGTPVFAGGRVSISDDGRVVGFTRFPDGALIVRDLTAGTSTVVSDPPAGKAWADSASPRQGMVSGDGSALAFTAQFNGTPRLLVFQRDLAGGGLTTISRSTSGGMPNGNGNTPLISDDASTVAWASDASDLVTRDSNGDWDMFVRGPDTFPPIISTAPTPRLVTHSQAGNRTIPVTVAWNARDASGICSYALSASLNGAAFSPVTLSSQTSKSRAFAYTAGPDTRQYQVAATDCSGNPPSIGTGPAFTTNRYQESSPDIARKGTWSRGASTSYVGGRDIYTTSKGSSVRLTFSGRSVAWVSPTSPTRGKAAVYIDGTKVATVSLRSGTKESRQLVFTRNFAQSASHTLRIVALSDARIDLDEVIVIT